MIDPGSGFAEHGYANADAADILVAISRSEIIVTNTTLSTVTVPAEKEVKAAVQGQRALAAFLATGYETQHIQIFDEKNQAHQVELPTSALRLLVDILSELSNGNAVSVVPVHAELTTQEAADLLDRASEVAMEELAKQAQELEMGYK